MEYGISRRSVYSAVGYSIAAIFWLFFFIGLFGLFTTPREWGVEHVFSVINEVYNHSPKTPWFVMGWWFAIGFIIFTHRQFPSWKVVLKWLTIGMIGFLAPLVVCLVWM